MSAGVEGGDGSVTVTVNGRVEVLPARTTLGTVINRLSATRTGIAAAVGDEVVPRAEWDGRSLCEGDEIEILTAVQGG